MVKVTVLGSGSGGNCTYVESPGTRLLIDAGFSGRQIAQRLATIGRTLDEITAVLVTHEHSDHVQGLNVLCNRHKIPLYINRLTKEAISSELPGYEGYHVFATGSDFSLGDIHVETFTIPHDAADPVGFLLTVGSVKVGFLTDLGFATRLVVERIRQAHALLLEANHDLKLLQQDTKRPWATKQRILSRHGHLSNEAAAEVTRQIMSENLRHLYLGHLSRDCNRPELADNTVRKCLQELGASHTRLHVTSQDAPSPTLELI